MEKITVHSLEEYQVRMDLVWVKPFTPGIRTAMTHELE